MIRCRICPDSPKSGLQPQRPCSTRKSLRGCWGCKRFGLAAVTEHYLGITLAKEHSAADWSYRPLPRDWRNYAALDVELLIELETDDARELKSQGKDEWAAEEFGYALREGLHRANSIRFPGCAYRTSRRQPGPSGPWPWPKRYGEARRLARAYDIAPDPAARRQIRSSRRRRESPTTPANSGRSGRSTSACASTGGEQEKMFERYAPIQRKVKPKYVGETIIGARWLCRSAMAGDAGAQQPTKRSANARSAR